MDIGPLFQTPEEVAKQAIENDVHVIGISTLAAAHKTLIPSLIKILGEMGADDIQVVCGGIIPPADQQDLLKMGVKAIFGPGTTVIESARKVLALLD